MFIIFIFIFFASKVENPGFGVTEVSKKEGEMWSKHTLHPTPTPTPYIVCLLRLAIGTRELLWRK